MRTAENLGKSARGVMSMYGPGPAGRSGGAMTDLLLPLYLTRGDWALLKKEHSLLEILAAAAGCRHDIYIASEDAIKIQMNLCGLLKLLEAEGIKVGTIGVDWNTVVDGHLGPWVPLSALANDCEQIIAGRPL